MVVVSKTTNPNLSCMLWFGGAARRFARGSLLHLTLVAFTSVHFRDVTFEVIPSFGTLRVVCPPLTSKVLSREKFL